MKPTPRILRISLGANSGRAYHSASAVQTSYEYLEIHCNKTAYHCQINHILNEFHLYSLLINVEVTLATLG